MAGTPLRKIARTYGLLILLGGIVWLLLAPIVWKVIVPITDRIDPVASRVMFWGTSWLFWLPGALLALYGLWAAFQNPTGDSHA